MPVGPWLPAAIAGGVSLIGMGIAKGKDKRQLLQQEKLQNLQIRGQQQLLDYSMGKELEMWEKTGYEAQKQQMKDAGINPALMYGMGGGGAQTIGTGNAGNVTGGQAPSGSGRETEEMLGMGIQLALLKAQKENIEADTKVKLEEAELKPIQREKTGVEISKINSEVEQITKQVELITKTLEHQIQKIKGEAESAWTKGKVDTKTVNDQIEQKQQEAIQVSLKNANISQDTAQKIAEIAQKWKSLDLEERKTAVLELTGGEQKNQDQIINVINTIVTILTRGRR